MAQNPYLAFLFHLVRVDGMVEKILLSIQNKWFKLKHGITRYGCGLFVIEKINRLLGLERLHQQSIIRKSAIDTKYLK